MGPLGFRRCFLRKGGVVADVGSIQNLKDLNCDCRREERLFCGSFLRKGEVFAYGGHTIAEEKKGFSANPWHGRARSSPMVGTFKP